MRTRAVGLGGLLVGLVGAAVAQPPAAAKPEWAYAHDLRVRKGGDKDFTKDTPKVGVEFFKLADLGALVAVSQTGGLAVAPLGPVGAEKKAAWLFAHDLRARKSDEERFTPTTAKFGVEVFKDTASGKLLYVSQAGGVALADPPAQVGTDKDPAWHHALVLKVRGPKEDKFGADTKKFGVEAFKDGNTGGLVYVSEAGFLAAAPAPAAAPPADAVKAPKALYGMSLRVRKAGEADFTDKTRKVGVEVFRDDNTGGLLYVSETGAVAAVPAPAEVGSGKGVPWKAAMELKARPGGEADFAKAARYGVEVFTDNNTGYLVFVDDAGGLAVLPPKK